MKATPLASIVAVDPLYDRDPGWRTARIFDGFPEADAMRQVAARTLALVETALPDELEAADILAACDTIAAAIGAVFGVDRALILSELIDQLDRTIWADLPGGVNDPFWKQVEKRGQQ